MREPMMREVRPATGLDAIRERAENLSDWLKPDGGRVFEEQAHLDAGTDARAYWHYGYLVALRDVLRLLDRQPTSVN